jgi:alginate O-acetyltransferase complex protein AlgJ
MGLLARHRRPWSLLVLALLALPMLLQALTPGESVSPGEARTLRSAPELPHSWRQWLALPRALDGFLSDHFGLRETLVHANARLRYALVSPTDGHVVYGRGNWLFLNGDAMLQQSMGLLLRQAEIGKFADFAAALRDELRQKNIAFIVTVPPNSSTIIRARLPRWAAVRPVISEYDLMLQALAARNVPVVDLRPPLLEADAAAPVYRRTDTHWNTLGALLAYNALVAGLDRPGWSIDPQRVTRGTTKTPGGDLARMLGVAADVAEAEPAIDLSPYSPTLLKTTAIDTQQRETGGAVTETSRAGPTVLVLGDSFTEHFWTDYFGLHVGRFVWMHHELCGFLPSVLAAQHPHVVVLAPTERFMFCWNK